MNTIDSRAPRTNQLLVSSAVLIAYLVDAPIVLPAVAAVLVFGVLAGPRYILSYQLYFRLIQPRLGEGRVEDARKPNFAQLMGAGGLLVAHGLISAGLGTAGWLLTGGLAAAALYSVARDFCLGCKTYELLAKLRGVTRWRASRLEPADVGLDPAGTTVVEFLHPMCHDCQLWQRRLQERGEPFVTVDVSQRPDLADRYGIALVPTVLEVAPDGLVLRQLAP
jgi:hypothetical protein